MTFNLNHKQNFKLSLDKILFIIACTYLIMVIFGLVTHGKLKLPGMTNSSKQSTDQQQTISLSDAQFIAYLQQSLEILERKQQQQTVNNPKPTSNSIPTQAIKVPPPPLPSNPPSTTSTPPRVVEKIYIPVYPQNQQPSVAVNPPSAVIPVKPTSPTRLNVPPPPPLPVTSQPQNQLPKVPTTVPVLTPEVSILPETAPSPSSSSTNSTGTLLVGLLAAGEQSSALFTINGKTRRVQLGEGIGTTGWLLKSVENQQVVIIRNGTVRSLEVGQNF